MLDALAAQAATAAILEAHSIPAAVSKNMRDMLPVTQKTDAPSAHVVLKEAPSRTEEAVAPLQSASIS